MGRKSSAKANNQNSAPPPEPPRSKAPLIVAGLALVALAAGAVTFLSDPPSSEQAAAAAPAFPDRGPIPSDLKPHKQERLPALQFPAYPMARSPEVVRAAYTFAAEHPEILSYVPCFCGCERSGHRGNHDCFVKARAINGDVVEWDEHGMECAVCIDVATRSQQLFASGANVRDIRAAVEKEFQPHFTTHTPTPEAPHNH